MTDNCETTREALGLGGGLGHDEAEHASKCLACSALGAEFEALDELLGGEPTPLAPFDLAADVMRIVREWRRAELRAIRWQISLALVAAILVAVVGSLGVPLESSDAWWPTVSSLLARVQTTVLGLQAQVDQVLRFGVDGLPSPPLVALLILIPILALGNWSLCRGRSEGSLA